jgi:hypothetical protein
MTDDDAAEAPAGAETSGTGSEAVAAVDAPTKRKPRARRTRGVITWVLIVLASLLIPISVMSAWAIRTVTNTDQYVATMAPLARNPVIIDHLARRATDELFSSHVVQDKVESLLPAKAKPIIKPVLAEVQNYVYGITLKVLESEQFGKLWDTLNRHTHDTVVDVLTGKQTTVTESLGKKGQVVINVTPIINNIIEQANARGVTIFNPIKPLLTQGNSLGISVVSKQQVSKFAGLFNTLVTLGWAVPVTALALGIIGIAIAVDRRKALLRMSVGVGLFTLVLLGALDYIRNTFIRTASNEGLDGRVAAVIWDTVVRFLKTDFRWMVLATVLVALIAWVFGPARYAGWIRSHCARGGRWVWAQAAALKAGTGQAAAGSPGARRTGAWILEHLNGLRIVGVVVAALFVLFSGDLTGWSLLLIVIVLAVYLGLLQLVALWARRITSPEGGGGSLAA